jgi:hypothetical protein
MADKRHRRPLVGTNSLTTYVRILPSFCGAHVLKRPEEPLYHINGEDYCPLAAIVSAFLTLIFLLIPFLRSAVDQGAPGAFAKWLSLHFYN